MSMDQSQQPGLGQLPYSVLSLLVNQLSPTGQGVLRATASHERTGVDAVVQSVTSRADLLNLPELLLKLKALKSLTLASGSFSSSPACYSELSAHVPAVVDSLAALTSLTSLTLSATAAQQLGALRWAHMESQNAAKGAGPTFISRIAEATGVQQRPSPLDQFYWVPDWLAAAPNVQQLVIQHTDNSSSSSSRPSSSQPGWLWLQPTNAWASKLQDLQLHGVPLLLGPAALTLQELTGLQRLAVTGACLRPSAVQQLLQALGHCAALTSLVLSGNDLCLLPEKGWQRVTGLKELDVSHQMLLELPAGLSCLTTLTALQLHHNSLSTMHTELTALSSLQHLAASHNWLSGAKGCLPLLLPSWPSLAVLELDNVSDKRGPLTLPPQLAECRELGELSVKDNFGMDWASVLEVLPSCQGLRMLRVDKRIPPERLQDLQAVQPAGLIISLE